MGKIGTAWPILVGLCTPAYADDAADAAKHIEKGLLRYNAEDYDGAIAELREAYDLVPDNDTLFAIGQAQRLKGDCKSALVTYRMVAQKVKSVEQADEVKKVTELCMKEIGPQGRTPAPTPEPVVKAEAKPERRPWFKDPLAVGLLIGGAGAIAIGGTFFMLGRSAESEAESATNYDDFASAASNAKRDRVYSAVGFGIGGALLVGAIVRIVTRDDSTSVTAQDGGATVSFARRF